MRNNDRYYSFIRFISFFTLLFLLSMGPGISQNISDSALMSFNTNRLRYNVSIGSEFTAIKGFGSAFVTTLTPSVTYRVSKKFEAGGGISFNRTNYFDVPKWNAMDGSSATTGNFSSATLFITGRYQASERFTIFGSAYKQIPVFGEPLPYNPFNPYSTGKAQGVDVNIGYRVGKNLFFQAGFRYTEGGSLWQASPYYPYDAFRGSSFPGFYPTW